MSDDVNTQLPLSIYIGESKDYPITVLDEDCDPIDITSHVLYFTVKLDECDVLDEEILIYKDSTDTDQIEINADQMTNPGKAIIKIVPADTATMEPRSYFYDVWLENPAGGRSLIAGIASFFVKQPITIKFTAP